MQRMLLFASISALLGAAGLAVAQPSEVRTDQGPKGSNITPGPGRPPGNTPGGATSTNPGGLAKNPHDVPAVPYTASQSRHRRAPGRPTEMASTGGNAKAPVGALSTRPEFRMPRPAKVNINPLACPRSFPTKHFSTHTGATAHAAGISDFWPTEFEHSVATASPGALDRCIHVLPDPAGSAACGLTGRGGSPIARAARTRSIDIDASGISSRASTSGDPPKTRAIPAAWGPQPRPAGFRQRRPRTLTLNPK